MEIDDRKFAAIIRHFGVKFEEGDEDAYMLTFPLSEWVTLPKGIRVLPADLPVCHHSEPCTKPTCVDGCQPLVQFVAFVDKKGTHV